MWPSNLAPNHCSWSRWHSLYLAKYRQPSHAWKNPWSLRGTSEQENVFLHNFFLQMSLLALLFDRGLECISGATKIHPIFCLFSRTWEPWEGLVESHETLNCLVSNTKHVLRNADSFIGIRGFFRMLFSRPSLRGKQVWRIVPKKLSQMPWRLK